MSQSIRKEHKWGDFLRLYDKADDRSSAILFGARLDDFATNALERLMKNRGTIAKQLLSESGPIGSFSAKIDLLWCLGAIDEDVHHDLHTIRKIRNKFAHGIDHTSFGLDPIKALVQNLRLPPKHSEATETTASLKSQPRIFFMVSAALCDGILGRVSDR